MSVQIEVVAEKVSFELWCSNLIIILKKLDIEKALRLSPFDLNISGVYLTTYGIVVSQFLNSMTYQYTDLKYY